MPFFTNKKLNALIYSELFNGRQTYMTEYCFFSMQFNNLPNVILFIESKRRAKIFFQYRGREDQKLVSAQRVGG